MDRKALSGFWDQFRQKYGVYLRLLEAIPGDRYQTRPVPNMRTPAEMVAHVSGTVVRDVVEGIRQGAITAQEGAEGRVAASLGTREAALAFARDCWARADEAVASMGDAELSAIVSTPWDMSFPGWVGFQLMNDEFVHHRGQLYAYARQCGGEPPFMWGFEDNEPGFRPQ